MKTPTIFLCFLTFGMVIFGILASPVSKAQYPSNIQNQNGTNTTFGDTTFYNRDQDNSTDLPLPPPPIQRQIHPSYSGHQLTSAFSSDSIACDGNIDTPYNCYQCFDAVAGKYFWGSSCKAKKLASADMVNGKCGLDYACTTKGIGTCPYNNYCPDNKKNEGTFILGPKGSGDCSEGTQIKDEKTCKEACTFLNLPLGEILGNFGCYKDGQGNCYQNGRQGSGASMICKTSEKISDKF